LFFIKIQKEALWASFSFFGNISFKVSLEGSDLPYELFFWARSLSRGVSMSGTFSKSLRRLTDSHSASKKAGKSPYAHALEAFWRRDYAVSAAMVTKALAEDPHGIDTFLYYRLWIEILAETGDKDSLQELKRHLFRCGQENTDNHATFFVLRGLVHFELDEFAAAQLASTAVIKLDRNPYALELTQRVAMRQAPARVSPQDIREELLHLVKSKAPLRDYFHWYYLIQALQEERAEQDLAHMLEFMGRAFPKSPVPQIFEYHRCMERGFFAGAATVAERLIELAPEIVDYMYYLAYALFEDGDYPSARKVLHEANRVTSGLDAEIIGLLGHCHAKLGGAAEASDCLKKAIQLLEKEGQPSSHVAMEYLEVQAELQSHAKADTKAIPREPQGWIIELSQRRVYELMNSPENVLEHLLRPLGNRAMPGDLCFFTVSSSDSLQWKIVAVYAVESEPIWHPVHGHHSILKHVTTFPKSIAIDIEPMSVAAENTLMDQEDALSLRHHWSDIDRLARKFGVDVASAKHAFALPTRGKKTVYHLDAEALIIVEQAISAHRDDMIERRKSLDSRRPTA
jgi:tetratricopeptide (TPR) repeat protein